MAADQAKTISYLEKNNKFATFLKIWVEFHPSCIIYSIRKASFLGLLSLFKLSNQQMTALPVPITLIFQTMAKDLKKLAYEQKELASGNKNTDMDDMYTGEFGDDDDIDLEDMIKQTHDEIDDLGDDFTGPEFDYDAYEVLSEIENYIYTDDIDKVNEVLMFEKVLTEMQKTNPELFSALHSSLTEKQKNEFSESVSQVKALETTAE